MEKNELVSAATVLPQVIEVGLEWKRKFEAAERRYQCAEEKMQIYRETAEQFKDRICCLEDAIRWALGEDRSDFGENKPQPNENGFVPEFWWREELRKRSSLK